MLEVKNISVRYGKRVVLRDTSVSFEKGRITAVIGANGCGKTTLLRTLLGILPSFEGEILIDGEPLSRMKPRDIAQRVAYLAQEKAAPDMTVEQMVLHGRFPYLRYPRGYTSYDRQLAHAAMERMGIEGLAEEPLSSLSGGMRQNAYVAMALAQDTDYVLLDEPTTYLDISHQLSLMRSLRALADEGKGIVAVMHDLPMALAFSDRVAVMEEGRIVAMGRGAEICASGLLPKIFGVDVRLEGSEYRYRFDT